MMTSIKTSTLQNHQQSCKRAFGGHGTLRSSTPSSVRGPVHAQVQRTEIEYEVSTAASSRQASRPIRLIDASNRITNKSGAPRGL